MHTVYKIRRQMKSQKQKNRPDINVSLYIGILPAPTLLDSQYNAALPIPPQPITIYSKGLFSICVDFKSF
jgi:hypothetical protein